MVLCAFNEYLLEDWLKKLICETSLTKAIATDITSVYKSLLNFSPSPLLPLRLNDDYLIGSDMTLPIIFRAVEKLPTKKAIASHSFSLWKRDRFIRL